MTLLDPRFATRSGQFEVTVATSPAQVASELDRLTLLMTELTDLPVTSRWPWLSASVLDPTPTEHPWTVTVAIDGHLVAAAVLIDDTSGPVRRTTLAGTAEDHRGGIYAVDDAAATELGRALAAALMDRPRDFAIGPLPVGPTTTALLDTLPVGAGVIVDTVSVPMVRSAPNAGTGMSHGTARTLRKARNRLASDGVEATIDITSDSVAIIEVLPLLESISRERDEASGRLSPLDDLGRRQLWERRVRTLAATGQLELASMRLNGRLAAYVLGINDGRTYRILEGRYVTRWARYSPGRLLEAAVLDNVMHSEQLDALDWMTPVAPETLLAANDVDHLVTVRGCRRTQGSAPQ